MYWRLFTFFSAIKLLFLPAYRSTDFEVHRNWLAITHSLPLKQWYIEKTSEWTLDYPPFFAYFEWCLSQAAAYFDKNMLIVTNLNYASENTILFQRLSVILFDIVFALGIKRCLDCVVKDKKVYYYVSVLLLGNIGLLMVDHIHFQYNGFLFGVLLLSVAEVFRQKYIRSALYFAILLNLKHIFMYIAPVYAAFMFRFYCIGEKRIFTNTLKLGLTVGIVTICSFGPFYDQIPQLIERLFPFKRGLSHAYWAPNFWALYNFVDKVLAIVMRIDPAGKASNTGGLVQTFEHTVLPPITPLITFILTFIFIVPCIFKIFFGKFKSTDQPIVFIQSIVICAATSFLFGWHVHEKAILLVIIPITLLTYLGDYNAKSSLFISFVGHYSLFPLLFPPELTILKLSLYIFSVTFSLYGFKFIFNQNYSQFFNIIERYYLYGLTLVYLYENVIHNLIGLDKKLPFLPLMLTSVYCSLGVLGFWAKYYFQFLFVNRDGSINEITKRKVKNK